MHSPSGCPVKYIIGQRFRFVKGKPPRCYQHRSGIPENTVQTRRPSIEKQPDGTYRQKFKYIGYFEKADLAYSFLAEYNNGKVVKEHMKYASSPTFEEMYRKWEKWRKGLKSNPTPSTWRNYEIALKHLAPLHSRQIISIRKNEAQEILNSYNHKSKATITSMKVVLKGVWAYAINEGFVEKDISEGLAYEWTDPNEEMHVPYTEEEIKFLWEKLYEINNVDILHITKGVYTHKTVRELLAEVNKI